MMWSQAAFSPDGGRVVTAGWDHTARVWDAATGKELMVLRHDDDLGGAAFSPDGKRIITAAFDNTARIFDAATGKEIGVLRGHENYVLAAGFDPSGTRIVTASADHSARIWRAGPVNEIAVLRHGSSVAQAALSPDGTRVVTAVRRPHRPHLRCGERRRDRGAARPRRRGHRRDLQSRRPADRDGIGGSHRADLGRGDRH